MTPKSELCTRTHPTSVINKMPKCALLRNDLRHLKSSGRWSCGIRRIQSIHLQSNPLASQKLQRGCEYSSASSGTSRDRHNQFCKQREPQQYKLTAKKVPHGVPKNALFLASQFHLCIERSDRNAVSAEKPHLPQRVVSPHRNTLKL